MADDKQHNDFLEKLFQQKAGEFNIPYREEDWNSLEKKLDIRDLQRSYRKKIAWIAAASVLLISLLGYFTYDNASKINEIARQMESVEEAAPDMEQLHPNDYAAAETDEDNGAEEPVDEISDADTEIAVIDLGEDSETQSDMEQLVQREVYSPHEQETERMAPEAVNYNQRHPGAKAPTPVDGIAMISENKAALQRTGFQPIEIEENDGWLTIRDFPEDTGVHHLKPSRISVGIILSPDFSTAGALSNFHDPGYKYGITTEFKLSSNLALIGGIVLSDVRYTAHRDEYNPPAYWNQGQLPDETVAICKILDIPLSLKYNFLNYDSSRFFATAGLSSYIMLNEDYSFYYEQPGEDFIQQLNVRNGSRHLLNNAGFTLGYEVDLHQNWSLRAEPFIQIPLGGVGWGNVDLYSVGSFISVHMKL